MGNFYQDIILADARYASPNACNDALLLEPVTREAVASIIASAKAEYGIDMIIFETFRSQARQEKLFTDKATQLQTVGVHGYGLACDLVKSINGRPSWAGDFSFLGPLARRFGLIWGGDWGTPLEAHSFRDYDHVQRCSVADQDRLFDGSWYPDAEYVP